MNRRLTDHLAELAGPALGGMIAPGEGFEVILAGSPVPWRQEAPPVRDAEGWVWQLAQADAHPRAGDTQGERPQGGPLKATLRLLLRPSHRAAVYCVQLTNAGAEPLVIEALYPLVVRFPRLGGAWQTLTAGGGTSENFYPPRAYRLRQRVVFGGEVRVESGPGGRSSEQYLPLLLAMPGAEETGTGLFCGMEYSGEWFLALRHVGDGPFLRGRLKMSDIVLAPAETLDLPAAHVGFYDGGLEGGTNALRRYVRDCVLPGSPTRVGTGLKPVPPLGASPGQPVPPVVYNHWFGIGGDCDERLISRQIARAAEIGCEVFVHDAGWFEGGFPRGVGNWHRADPQRYPQGLEPLAEAARAAGMKFGLWLEIEHAREGTWAAEGFPQLFFPPSESRGGKTFHLNLARPDACDWALETLTGWVKRLGLEWLRLDYNLDPAAVFRAADETGKIQLAYYRGLCRLLDALRGEHPGLLVEACSGGGRRIDLATLRRSDALWMSDQSFTPDICRYMQCRFGRLLPSHLAGSAVSVRRRAGAGATGPGDVLARACGALGFSGDIASWPRPLAERMRKWVDAYKQVRHLLAEDFFQLLPIPATDREWDAVQFARPDGSEMLVLAFRMGGAQGRMNLSLRALRPGLAYLLTNVFRPARPRRVSGADLARRGLAVTLKPHEAVCLRLAPP